MDDLRHNHLFLWSLATFHAGLLVLILVLLLYRFGDLAGALGGVGTVPGVILFVALWLSTWWTTGRALRGSDWTPNRPPQVENLLKRGVAWGGVNGILFFECLLAYFVLSAFGTAMGEGKAFDVLRLPPAGLIEALFGAIPAFLVGATIGFIFAVLDMILLELGRRLFSAYTREATWPPQR